MVFLGFLPRVLVTLVCYLFLSLPAGVRDLGFAFWFGVLRVDAGFGLMRLDVGCDYKAAFGELTFGSLVLTSLGFLVFVSLVFAFKFCLFGCSVCFCV